MTANSSLFILPCISLSLIAFLVSVCLTGCSSEDTEKNANSRSQYWFEQGKETVAQRKRLLEAEAKLDLDGKAKNIIFILGDGMGVSTLTASRIFVGQEKGLLGEEFSLSFEDFPHTALIKTYNVDLQTPDSAGTMSALMTGMKTDEGIISLPASVSRGDCASMTLQDKKLPTLLDIAKAKGKSTAVVTTARITHATPATTYAHSVDRNWESDDAMPQVAKEMGCLDIASQLIEGSRNNQAVDIILGGGRRHFLPTIEGGKRLDGKNLIQQWQQQGVRLYVYSSGSVQAQQLLFKHSDAGDLTPLFSGYFDTRIGAKREISSYAAILQQLQLPPKQVLFLSDVVAELDAASQLGIATVQLVREGQTHGTHPVAKDFADVQELSQ